MKENLANVKNRFDPVREVYETLTKFEVTVKDEELLKLSGLQEAFEDFVSMLQDADKMLEKSKGSMKRELESQMDQYSNQMTEIRAASQIELPFSNEKPPEEALALIESYRVKISKGKEREASLSTGLAIFSIPSTEHKDLSALIKDVDFLTQIWEITIEWKSYWDGWKSGQFADLNTDEMETIAGGFTKKVGKLGRDIKRWRVWEAMKAELDRFKEIVPLIQDLRNHALRPRHWASLIERVGQHFDPHSSDFTLNEVVKLGNTNYHIIILI